MVNISFHMINKSKSNVFTFMFHVNKFFYNNVILVLLLKQIRTSEIGTGVRMKYELDRNLIYSDQVFGGEWIRRTIPSQTNQLRN